MRKVASHAQQTREAVFSTPCTMLVRMKSKRAKPDGVTSTPANCDKSGTLKPSLHEERADHANGWLSVSPDATTFRIPYLLVDSYDFCVGGNPSHA
jgi:hypothetical protein